MASVLTCTAGDSVSVSLGRTNGKVDVKVGDTNFYLTRDEAAQLAADLLDVLEGRKAA